MSNYADWRAVGTQLARKSELWREATNEARVLWLQLLLSCDNFGTFEGDVYIIWKQCTKQLGWNLQETMQALSCLFAVQLVHGFIVDGTEHVHIAKFDEHQPGRFLNTRGKRRSAVPPCENGGICSGFVDSDGDTGHNTDHESGAAELEQELEIEGTNVLVSDTVADAHSSRSDDAVWQHWVEVAAPTQVADPTRVKPTDERWRRLTARRADGYTDAELIECINGFVADNHHRGINEQRTPYLDFPTIFKSSSKVDDGIRRARRGGALVSVGTEAGRPSRVRPQ